MVVAETNVELLATGVTAPILLSRVKAVALVVVHESVDGSRKVTAVGDAVSVQSGGSGMSGPYAVKLKW